ncbi:MAG: rhomboid family intramembrane serine protease [Crocinitomicaceae bacterium]|nr:rhomboid family intramembrane serine protease [Crocinitomicaceae bacterium]
MIESAEHKYFPWFTTLFSVLLIVVYSITAYLSHSTSIDFKLLEKFGAPYAIQIYLGHVYGVVLNNLIHVNLFHLLSNLLGLWLFGAFIERRIGWFKMATFGLVCSVFGSIIQLAMTNDAGLGISSSVFGFYALILIMSFKNRMFRMRYIYGIGAVLFGSLIFMSITNSVFGQQVAIEAKIGGIFWGFLTGLAQNEGSIKWQYLTLFVLPFSIAASSLLYAPWSSEWQCARGIYFHQKNDLNRAEQYYQASIKINIDNALAKNNYTLIKIDRLSKLAYNAHVKGEYTGARRLYLKILALNKNNRWALNNLKELP